MPVGIALPAAAAVLTGGIITAAATHGPRRAASTAGALGALVLFLWLLQHPVS